MKNKLEKPDGFSVSKVEKFSIEKIESLPIRDFEKADLILLLTGLKTAIDINVPRDNKDWHDAIKALGLYSTEDEELGDENKRKFYIARSREDAEKLHDAFVQRNNTDAGILSGYPPSAVENYRKTMNELLNPGLKGAETRDLLENRFMESVDLPPEAKAEELLPFIQFRLSAKNWREEVEVVRKWVETIKNLDPKLYARIQDYYKK